MASNERGHPSLGHSPDHYLQGHSCSHCQKIVLPGSPQTVHVGTYQWRYDSLGRYQTYYESLDEIEFREVSSWSHLGLSGRDVRIASRAGCEFANSLLRQMDHGFMTKLQIELDDIQFFSSGADVLNIYQLVPLSCLHSSKTETLGLHLNLEKTYLAANHSHADYCIMCDLWIGDDTQKRYGPSQDIAADPLSHETISSVKEWMKQCTSEEDGDHKVCSLSGSNFFPSRLIEVKACGSAYSLRIISGKSLDKTSEYVTLSYCWGGDQEGALKLGNIHQYEQNIPWENVARTIQDAVVTTHKLGIRFLWVDSLCILQDSDIDKAKEINEMSQIYSSSTLTIMARRADKATDGFLHERVLPSGTSLLRYRSYNGEIDPVNLIFRASVTKEENIRLNTRGWVMQEHILSRRLLIVGTWQTSWCCRRDRGNSLRHADGDVKSHRYEDCDAFQYEQVSRWDHQDLPSAEVSVFHNNYPMDAILSVTTTPEYEQWRPEDEDILDEWYKMVEAFSARSLTDQADRILAVSGIAKRFSALLPGRYVAGFWEKNLISALTWTRNTKIDGEPRNKPSQYTGPSWSWTAVSSSVQFLSPELPPLIEVLSVNCIPMYEGAPFGALKSGTLTLRGPAINIEWQCNGQNQKSQWRYKKDDDIYIDPDLSIDLDSRELDTSWISVTLLGTNPPEWDDLGGIVLIQNDQGQYRRLGFFSADPSKQSWDDELEDPPKLPHFSQWAERTFEII